MCIVCTVASVVVVVATATAIAIASDADDDTSPVAHSIEVV